MKSIRIIALLVSILVGLIFSLPLFFKTISVQEKIDIYAPVPKAYEAISSSYADIFMDSEIEMISKWKRDIIDSTQNKFLSTLSDNGKIKIKSKLDFENRYNVTRLKFSEEISFHSWFDQAYGILFSKSIQRKRENFYVRVKQAIESTPDASIKPEELK